MTNNELSDFIFKLGTSSENIFYNEIYISLRDETVLLHDLDSFETIRVAEILRDRIALQELNLQKHHSFGLEIASKKLLSEKGSHIRQIKIMTAKSGYTILLTLHAERLISCYKNELENLSVNLEYQINLKKSGYPNKNIFLIENGIIKG